MTNDCKQTFEIANAFKSFQLLLWYNGHKSSVFLLLWMFFEKLFCNTNAPEKNYGVLGNNYRCEKMQARVYFYFHKKNAVFWLGMGLEFYTSA